MARVSRIPALALAAAALAVFSATGCREDPPPPLPPQDAAAPAPPASDWMQLPETVVLELSEDDLDTFAAAAERARAAAPLARERFEPAAPGEPDAWFVLVGLPVARGEGLETVWVAVDRWTEHRIEGRLASPPSRPLRSARGVGDPVAFAARELLDWLHRPQGSRVDEGGFTLDALEPERGAVEWAVPTRRGDGEADDSGANGAPAGG